MTSRGVDKVFIHFAPRPDNSDSYAPTVSGVAGEINPSVHRESSCWQFEFLNLSRGESINRSSCERFGKAVTPALPRQIFTGSEIGLSIGAGEGIRTLDPDLGKVVLYP